MPAYRNITITLIAILTLSACSGLAPALPPAAPTVTETLPLSATPFQPPTLTPTETATLIPTATVTPVPSPNPIRLTFASGDGRELVGYFYPSWKPNAPVVVMMHQFEGSQSMWQQSPLITWLQNWPPPDAPLLPTPSADGLLPIMPPELSFAVFTFDFRGHGESLPDDIIQDGFQAHAQGFLLDARAAYQTARQMPGVNPEQVIGLGTSIGGDAVVDACAEGCIGAFSISPGSFLKVDYGQTAQRLVAEGKPVRCMYAANDYPSPATCLSLAPSEHYKTFAYPGKKHGMEFVILPRKMEADFGANFLEFLKAAIQ